MLESHFQEGSGLQETLSLGLCPSLLRHVIKLGGGWKEAPPLSLLLCSGQQTLLFMLTDKVESLFT